MGALDPDVAHGPRRGLFRRRGQPLHGGHELARIDRLGEIRIEAGAQDPLLFLEAAVRREREGGHTAVVRALAYLTDERIAVLDGHRDVADDDVELAAIERLD